MAEAAAYTAVAAATVAVETKLALIVALAVTSATTVLAKARFAV